VQIERLHLAAGEPERLEGSTAHTGQRDERERVREGGRSELLDTLIT
jgi:hypothetical protein